MSGQGPVELVGVYVFQQSGPAIFLVRCSSPIAGPSGGMNAATELLGTGSRRVPRAVRALRTRPGFGIGKFLPLLGSEQAPQACGAA
ncbi:hypothetical protein XFF6166_370083 [Xanthomonas citri pv. fuscans]|nr:hypothetical protein XFF4834R_chr39420 [Xanthomonas citri pv. fuscans]SON78927.1 hypothetical protein XFF6166_370083 [Xanthomonas citri pv. fuscans]SON99589.1 hypothetical protein XFF6960_180085 [Xanthomonas citri pv. fuscans]SOO05806.1 hypothetical protein XFF7767_50035 [Xanthomonas citri pv. fuscans]SOO07284.1 hypothetical protein XFF6970_10091 [Xanthomonas citri pv. fuscans]